MFSVPFFWFLPMRSKLVGGLLLVPAAIHLMPLYGLLGPAQLTSLYGLDFADPSLQILMRHRAVLFGLLGALLLAAAFRPTLRTLALIGGFASVVSFFALAYGIPGGNAQVMRVAAVDWVAFGCLVVAAGLHWRESRG
jgi:hypothetical protein